MRHHNAEELDLNLQRCGNLKSSKYRKMVLEGAVSFRLP